MPDLIRKTLETKLTAEDGERAVVARISTSDVDRDGDVVLPSGIDTTDFEKNPVVLMQHRADMPPIGRAERIQRGAKYVTAKVHFPERPVWMDKGSGWPPDEALAYYQSGLLNAFSIGFQIDDARPATTKDIERHGDGCRRVISKWKLLEFSAVAIPANQNALAMAVSKSQTWFKDLQFEQSRKLLMPAPRKIQVAMPRKIEVAA